MCVCVCVCSLLRALCMSMPDTHSLCYGGGCSFVSARRMFLAGSHRWGKVGINTDLHDIRISDESEQAVWEHVRAENSKVVSEPMSLGDVSFHHGWTLHRAAPNTTLRCREAHTIQYTGDTMRWSAAAPEGPTGFGGVRTAG